MIYEHVQTALQRWAADNGVIGNTQEIWNELCLKTHGAIEQMNKRPDFNLLPMATQDKLMGYYQDALNGVEHTVDEVQTEGDHVIGEAELLGDVAIAGVAEAEGNKADGEVSEPESANEAHVADDHADETNGVHGDTGGTGNGDEANHSNDSGSEQRDDHDQSDEHDEHDEDDHGEEHEDTEHHDEDHHE